MGAFQSLFQDLCAAAGLAYVPSVLVCARSRYGQTGPATGDDRKTTKPGKKDDKTLLKSTDDNRAGRVIQVSLTRIRLLYGRITRPVRPSGVEVCMGVGNPMGIPFHGESHGNGNSHTAHDGNGNGNKANGNGNSIYFTRVKIPKIIVMH